MLTFCLKFSSSAALDCNAYGAVRREVMRKREKRSDEETEKRSDEERWFCCHFPIIVVAVCCFCLFAFSATIVRAFNCTVSQCKAVSQSVSTGANRASTAQTVSQYSELIELVQRSTKIAKEGRRRKKVGKKCIKRGSVCRAASPNKTSPTILFPSLSHSHLLQILHNIFILVMHNDIH